MATSGLTYLVTGANRGIGRGLVSAFLQKPSATVIAAVRDPSKESSKALASIPKAEGTKLLVVKLDSEVETDARDAVVQLQNSHGITAIDVVVANAGINHTLAPVIQNSSEALLNHYAVNAIAPILLLQATADLLKASKTGNPRFVAISTFIASISGMEMLLKFPAPMSPYGSSKAALNWLIRRTHFEEPWLTTFVVHPGLVQTDMVAGVLEGKGIDSAAAGAIPVEQSVAGLVKVVDEATRATGGTFQNYDGTTLPW